MIQAYHEMMSWFNNGFGGNSFFLLYILCLIYLVFGEKKKIISVVVPSFLLTIFILNPVCYKYLWSRTIGYSYWRLFWIIPVIPVIALAGVSIVAKVKRNMGKALVIVFLAGIFWKAGMFTYQLPETTFTHADNMFKLPQSAQIIGTDLKSLSDSEGNKSIAAFDNRYLKTKVIADVSLVPYIRQIYPEIGQAYGRWGQNRSGSRTGAFFYDTFNGGNLTGIDSRADIDWTSVYNMCKSESYNYLIIPDADETPAQQFTDAGFECVKRDAGYKIIKIK